MNDQMSQEHGTDPVWKAVEPETVDFILSQGERYLETQLQASLSADQRALTAASFFGALGTAVLATAVAYWTDKADGSILFCGVATGVLFVIGALLCLYASRPVNFYSAGAEPASWYTSVHVPLSEAKGVEAENYQFYIDQNDLTLKANAKWLQAGMNCASTAPLVGLFFWGISRTF